MATPTNDWGVDVAKVASKISFLEIDANSDPDELSVQDWIGGYAAELNSVLVAVGYHPASITDASNPDAYLNCQNRIALRVAADVHLANQNGAGDLADVYIADWNSFLGRLRRNPQSIMGPERSGVSGRSHNTRGTHPPRPQFWKYGMKT